MQTGSGKDAPNPASVLVAMGDGFLQDLSSDPTPRFLQGLKAEAGECGTLAGTDSANPQMKSRERGVPNDISSLQDGLSVSRSH